MIFFYALKTKRLSCIFETQLLTFVSKWYLYLKHFTLVPTFLIVSNKVVQNIDLTKRMKNDVDLTKV